MSTAFENRGFYEFEGHTLVRVEKKTKKSIFYWFNKHKFSKELNTSLFIRVNGMHKQCKECRGVEKCFV